MTDHELDAYEQHEMLQMNGLAEDHLSDGLGKICQHCYETSLHWQETSHGWRLFNEKGEMHSCKGYLIHKRLNVQINLEIP